MNGLLSFEVTAHGLCPALGGFTQGDAMSNGYTEVLHRLVTGFHANAHDRLYSMRHLLAGSQQEIEIHRGVEGCKEQYHNLIDFWVHSLFSHLEDRLDDDEFTIVAYQSKCKSISEEETMQIFYQLTEGMRDAPTLDYDGEFIRSLQMFDKAHFKAIAVESSTEYFVLYWRDSVVSDAA
jgi:hypothetical protein